MSDASDTTKKLSGVWYGCYGTAPCPICQPQARKDQNALTLSDGKNGQLLLHCKKLGCNFKDILIAAGLTPGNVERDELVISKTERERIDQVAKLRARAQSLWDYAGSMTSTKGETYLRGRGITCELPETLRWLRDTYHVPSGMYCGAIIANVVPTGGVHRTFFSKKGHRLNTSAKMMLGPCAGGAVRLSESTGPLVVCEGLETGLSLLSGLLEGPHSVWAALSTSGMKGLILPDHPTDLIVATDGDPEGREAGEALARAANGKGWSVCLLPAPDGQDWNDVLRERTGL